MEKGLKIFETKPDRGYTALAWELPETKGDALIQICKDGAVVREFKFPAYKVWNIGAHLSDIVDSELAKNQEGYQMAASDGIGGFAPITPVDGENHV